MDAAPASQAMARGPSGRNRPAGRFFIPDSTGSSPSVAAHDTRPARHAHPGQSSGHHEGNIQPTHSRRVSEHYQQDNPEPPFWRKVDSQFSFDLGDYGTGEYSSRSGSESDLGHVYPGVPASPVAGPSTPPRRVRRDRSADISIPQLQPAFDPLSNPFVALAAASPHTPVRYNQPRAFYDTEPMSSPSPFTLARAAEGAGVVGMPGLPPHMYDVLLDIHQTLYCGQTYGKAGQGRRRRRNRGVIGSWGRRVKEVRRVVERSLESDCGESHYLVS